MTAPFFAAERRRSIAGGEAQRRPRTEQDTNSPGEATEEKPPTVMNAFCAKAQRAACK